MSKRELSESTAAWSPSLHEHASQVTQQGMRTSEIDNGVLASSGLELVNGGDFVEPGRIYSSERMHDITKISRKSPPESSHIGNQREEDGREIQELKRKLAKMEEEQAKLETEAIKEREKREKLEAEAIKEREKREKLEAEAIKEREKREKLEAEAIKEREKREKLEAEAMKEREKREKLEAKAIKEREKREKLEAEAIKERAEAIKERENREELSGVGKLLRFGLPPLGQHCIGSKSFPSYSQKSDIAREVKAHQENVDIISGYHIADLPKICSEIWMSTYGRKSLHQWSCESELRQFCASVMNDVGALAGVKISVSSEVYLDVANSGRPDVVLFQVFGQCIGVCEVKKCSTITVETNDLHHSKLFTQICNYLKIIQNYHGVTQPFGIVTTYKEWRVCWLGESRELASCTNVDNLVRCNPTSTLDNKNEDLYMSPVYQYNDPKLIEVLVSTVLRMYHGKKKPVSMQCILPSNKNHSRKFGVIDVNGEQKFSWNPLSVSVLSLSCPTSCPRSLYILQDFDGGADGRVWLTCSVEDKIGHLCVLKIAKRPTELNQTESTYQDNGYVEEARNWETCWGVTIHRFQVFKCDAILMPFAYHGFCENGKITFRCLNNCTSGHGSVDEIINSTQYQEKLNASQLNYFFDHPYEVAKIALTDMVNAGLIHQDIHWRHIALLPQCPSNTREEWGLRPILIDLHSCRNITSDDNMNEIITSGIDILRKEQESKQCTSDLSLES